MTESGTEVVHRDLHRGNLRLEVEVMRMTNVLLHHLLPLHGHTKPSMIYIFFTNVLWSERWTFCAVNAFQISNSTKGLMSHDLHLNVGWDHQSFAAKFSTQKNYLRETDPFLISSITFSLDSQNFLEGFICFSSSLKTQLPTQATTTSSKPCLQTTLTSLDGSVKMKNVSETWNGNNLLQRSGPKMT